MKRAWMLILLVSLGLNLGLGLHLWRESRDEPRSARGTRLEHRGPGRHDWPARGDTAGWRRVGQQRLERMTDRLGLDPEQARVLRENQARSVRRIAELREGVAPARDRVRNLLLADAVDTLAVREALSEVGRRQADLDSVVAETILHDLAVLEPDQRARYLRLLPFDDRPGPGSGRHRGRGRPRQ
jgi:Spy/CpxP family protein refolding chaperone